MNTKDDVFQNHGDWIFITPIGNLQLTDAVNNEFRVERVLFVDKAKLPRIRKRLGINSPLSEVWKSFPSASHFDENSQTLACIPHNGKPSEFKRKCMQIVRDELSILAASQLGYTKRRSATWLALFGEHRPSQVSCLFLNRKDSSKVQEHKVTSSLGSLSLDSRWKVFQERAFFIQLLNILNKKTYVHEDWRKSIRRAVVLVGQSFNTNNIPMAFLWNMIALETLLTKSGDKYSRDLPKRVEAFLGWSGFWATHGFEKRILEVYKKRSEFVHEGKRDKITKEDLLFTDDLILNLLINIVGLPKLFQRKDDIVDFAERVECERKLRLKPKVRPKALQYFSRNYSKEDYEDM